MFSERSGNMKGFPGALRMDFKRMFINPIFYSTIVVLFVFFTFNGAVKGGFDYLDNPSGIFSIWRTCVHNGYAVFAFAIASFPYTHSFCTDFENRNFRSEVIRTGTANYIAARIISVFLSAFIVFVISSLLYFAIIYFVISYLNGHWINIFYIDKDMMKNQLLVYADIVERGFWWVPIISETLLQGIETGIWALGGLCVSAFTTNKFIVIITPYLISYYLRYFMLFIPVWDFDLNSAFSLLINYSYLTIPRWIIISLYTVFFVGLFSMVFTEKAKRRIYYG